MSDAQLLTLLAAAGAAFGLALLSAVAGFGGGVLLLPVFTVLFGLRAAVPVLTGALVVLSAFAGEQQRPGSVMKGMLARFTR